MIQAEPTTVAPPAAALDVPGAPPLTVVIETSTEHEYEERGETLHDIDGIVTAVLAQRHTQPLDVVLVVTAASTEHYRRYASVAGIRLVQDDVGTYYSMKDAGARAVTTDYLVFLDRDCLPRPGWAAAAVAALDAGADVAAGKSRYFSTSWWARAMNFFDLANVYRRPDGTASAFVLNNVAFRRHVYLANPIDQRLQRCGGCFLLNLQLRAAGRRIDYEPAMRVDHGDDFGEGHSLSKRLRNGHVSAIIYDLDDTGVVPYRWLHRLGPLGAPLIVGKRITTDLHLLVRNRPDLGYSWVDVALVGLLAVPLRVVEGVAHVVSSVRPSIIGRRWH